MTSDSDRGIVTLPCHHSLQQTVGKLEETLRAKGVKLFAVVDHSGEAERAGMHMPPTKLLIFGNPKAGTPLMIASPSVAIDLPMKILVWEDANGKVWISYNRCCLPASSARLASRSSAKHRGRASAGQDSGRMTATVTGAPQYVAANIAKPLNPMLDLI
jgi:uncharacterized protein (DUF302 family)